MLFSTMVPVIIMLIVIYVVILKKIPEKYIWVSYIIIISISILYFLPGGVHSEFMGIENLALGISLVKLHYLYNG